MLNNQRVSNRTAWRILANIGQQQKNLLLVPDVFALDADTWHAI
jgi:hypothetical protein